jgi:hypothetical protein
MPGNCSSLSDCNGKLGRGDTLIIKGPAEYTISDTSSFTVSGSSWSGPVTYRAEPSGSVVFHLLCDACSFAIASDWIVIDGFEFIRGIYLDAKHIRIQNSEVHKCWGDCFDVGDSYGGPTTDASIELINLNMHDNAQARFENPNRCTYDPPGGGPCHLAYMDLSGTLIDGGGWQDGGRNWTARNVTLENMNPAIWFVSGGGGHKVYNSVFRNNTKGIIVKSDGSFYANTFYGNNVGISLEEGCNTVTAPSISCSSFGRVLRHSHACTAHPQTGRKPAGCQLGPSCSRAGPSARSPRPRASAQGRSAHGWRGPATGARRPSGTAPPGHPADCRPPSWRGCLRSCTRGPQPMASGDRSGPVAGSPR